MSRLITAALLLAALIPAAQGAQKAKSTPSQKASTKPAETRNIVPFKATERTLANGLKVIIVPTGFPNLVSVHIPVLTGSRNEVEPGKSGFAHFFEHMMFRGTKKFSSTQYQDAMTRAGARNNAYTTDDFTNYHATFAKEDLETILALEADRFQNLDYTEADFKTEAKAVLGEYNKNSANPISKLLEVQRDNAYSTHTYKHTTMGFIKDIEDMPNQFAYSKIFFDRWYRPENTAIIVAGDVNAEQVLPLVEKYWGKWKRGTYKVSIPAEPAATGPKYAHVTWPTATLPWVTAAFHGPAFSETEKDYAAIDVLMDLNFGPTSEVYKKLVEQEQKVDQLFEFTPANADPLLITIGARLKNPADAIYVRDEILRTVAAARDNKVAASRLAEAKSNGKYGFARTLDNTDSIASTLARFVRYRRSFDTLNNFYRVYESLTPEDLQRYGRKYLTDSRLIVTSLSNQPLDAAISKAPLLSSFSAASGSAASAGTADLRIITIPSALEQLNVKMLFTVGSVQDPKGKEGLALLTGAMISEAGSKTMKIDEITRALFPIAGGFGSSVDKEMTTFTGSIHKDNWERFFEVVMPQLTDPGFREDDFKRLRDNAVNALKQDLISNNEEELAKERLQTNIYRGTPYGHPVAGTVAGLQAITLEDVRTFARAHYTRANLSVGIAGAAPAELTAALRREVSKLPEGKRADPFPIIGRKSEGMEVEILEKDTRATAISFGHPIAVTRSHPDFAALWLARAWLGEHRSSVSNLYQRIREVRGMNYGDYAYIEAFPRGMFQFFPDPNIARRAQIFEVWIRPVVPVNAHMALRIAVHELEKLVNGGLSQEDFEATRNYLLKNVFVMTSTQNQEVGYALDSKWYGIGEFTTYMREQLGKLTRERVNSAVKKHLSATDLSVVIITKDAQALKTALESDAVSIMKYDAEKPAALLDEDKLIGSRKLSIRPEKITITPIDKVFAE